MQPHLVHVQEAVEPNIKIHHRGPMQKFWETPHMAQANAGVKAEPDDGR